MMKRTIAFMSLALVLTVIQPAAIPSANELATQPVASAVIKKDALQILGAEVLQPSSGTEQITASMTSAPLTSGIVAPRLGESPKIDIASISGNPQWFAVVDLFPCAMFEHDVIYVFIDDVTGAVTTYSASDWPTVNGVSLGEDTIPGEDLLLVFPLLPRPDNITPGSPTTEPSGDYGDAPDGQTAYDGVTGRFPTSYATTNSVLGRPGAHASATGLEVLGTSVSVEQDVVDPADPDGVTNIVDADSDERMFLSWDRNTTPGTSYLIYDVTVTTGAPETDRYVNVLFDLDRSGNWGAAAAGTEWAVVNQVVSVAPGSTATQISPAFSWGDGVPTPTQVWARVALTRSEIDPGIFGTTGWDGSGQFSFGEVEDFEVHLKFCPPSEESSPPSTRPPVRPGPWLGTGIKLRYHALVVQGRDHDFQTIVVEAADAMESALTKQGYETTRLSGAQSTAAKIQDWIDDLFGNLICEDRILIYFIAHGSPTKGNGGYIHLGSGEHLEGNDLNDILETIPPCEEPDDDCEEPDTCCDVTVIMESCFSGRWKDSLSGPGRRIITTSSSTQKSWAGADGSGGEYSDRYIKCAKDSKTDTEYGNSDGFVDPGEAHKCATDKLQRAQTPAMNNLTCDCVCSTLAWWGLQGVAGLGEPYNVIGTPFNFNEQLYVTTYNLVGAQVLRYTEEPTWTTVATRGFGNLNNIGISSQEEYNNTFYVGTWNFESGAEILCSKDGTGWDQASTGGFGDFNNQYITDFEVFDGYLYAATSNAGGGEVWRSNGGDWSQVNVSGFGTGNSGVYSLTSFQGKLYAGTAGGTSGGTIWVSLDGSVWTQVTTNGFGDSGNATISSLVEFGDFLYASANNDQTGIEIWRTPDGTSWTQINSDGFGDPQNEGTRSMVVFDDELYVGLRNYVLGGGIWKTGNGTSWTQVAPEGFGNYDNVAIWGMAEYDDRLYAGTQNIHGNQIWMQLHYQQIHLPLILRNFKPGQVPPPTPTPLYFDDFSDPDSGWPVVDYSNVATDYHNGNYLIQIKEDDLFIWVSPSELTYPNGTFEVKAWRSTGGNSTYGIVFGLDGSAGEFYAFIIQPYLQQYSLRRRDSDGWVTLIPYTDSSHINFSIVHNQLKVTRDGSQIELYVNDHHLASYSDSIYTCPMRRVGIYAGSGSESPVWLRYDDFTVWGPGYGTTSATGGGSVGVGTTTAPPD